MNLLSVLKGGLVLVIALFLMLNITIPVFDAIFEALAGSNDIFKILQGGNYLMHIIILLIAWYSATFGIPKSIDKILPTGGGN